MTVAFYAPMKPPGHPVPSGDRTMARAIIAALEQGGAQVAVASTLQTRDGAGDAEAQQQIAAKAQAEVARITAAAPDLQAWITYHNYYKAPDLIGPAVARHLRIPYCQIESTRAKKRLTGPWARFAQAAEEAADAARVIFYLTRRDAEALQDHATAHQELIHLRPFLPSTTLPPASTLEGPMLSVGMMRTRDKLDSYALIAETLAALPDNGWHLNIAGDGPARPQVEALMRPFAETITFLGALNAMELGRAYQDASLLFWPGVNEAFGLSYLEAQAHGLPVVAQDRPGVRDVLAPGVYPEPEIGVTPMATRLEALLTGEDLRAEAGARARAYVAENHLLDAAARTLTGGLRAAGVTV